MRWDVLTPSAGWNLAFYALHSHQIGMLSKEAQDEIWEDTYDAIMATASAPVKVDIAGEGRVGSRKRRVGLF